MKKIIYLLAFLSINAFSQRKYLTKSGTVNFEASVPSFEEVSAKNSSTTAILNTQNGEIAALILVKGFRFKNALMEEHFNENYAESDTYPKATFKGKIEDFVFEEIEETKKSFTLNGELIFHGESNKLENIPIRISKIKDGIHITGAFVTNPTDYDIKIPKIVSNKISEDISVKFDFQLQRKQ